MPLVGFQPTKARLVIENHKDSVLVMKVVLDPEDAVELTTGGGLQDLVGVLRIRERRNGNGNGNGHGPGHGNGSGSGNGNGERIGSLVFVPQNDDDKELAPAKFQVNVGMASDKFAMLMRVANAGRLPTKFFIDAGEPKANGGPPALTYRNRSSQRVKIWDNHAHRILPVMNFVMILPIDVATTAAPVATIAAQDLVPPVAVATNAQVAELVDDMLEFQSDTRNTMFGLVCVLGVVAIAALVIGLGIFFR
jgi:hypothetical protein